MKIAKVKAREQPIVIRFCLSIAAMDMARIWPTVAAAASHTMKLRPQCRLRAIVTSRCRPWRPLRSFTASTSTPLPSPCGNTTRWISGSGATTGCGSSLLNIPTRCFSSTSNINSNSSSDVPREEFDVVIVGGGVVGATLAHLLVQRCGTALRIAVVESSAGPVGTVDSTVPHPRSYALSPASMELIFGPESPPHLRGGYYQSMQIWEAGQPASLVLSTRDVPSPAHDSYLGCCVEDHVVQGHLWQWLASAPNVKLYPSTVCTNVQWEQAAATGWVHGALHAKDAATTPFGTRLLVAADGIRSAIRQAVGIEMMQLDYGQSALTFTVSLQGPRGAARRAYQRFLPTGPLALLPTWSPHHAVMVWSTTPADVQQWKAASPAALVAHLNELLQTGPQLVSPLVPPLPTEPPTLWSNLLYGVDKVLDAMQTGSTMAVSMPNGNASFDAPPLMDDIVSPQFSFDLSCQLPRPRQVASYTRGTHVAIVGDAAHTVHPLAGQGLNLGLCDVAALVECVERAVASGMPLGTFLHDYETSRRHQVGLTVAGIHGIQRLFATQSGWSKHVKAVGMNLIQAVGPLRQQLVQAACHGVVIR